MKDNLDKSSEHNNIPFLSVQGIQKRFGYKQILKGVDLDLFQGKTTLLMGKNGAGKSTLVSILTGLMRPTKGTVLFKGESVLDCAHEFRLSYGFITHQTLFYADLTAWENLLFFSRLAKVKDIKEKAEKALKKTRLEKAKDLQVKAFSSGMGKRLNIARLMIANPRLLFLDEPYSGLDLDSVDLFNEYLGEFKANGGTVLLISHQLESCLKICDTVALLNDGRIDQSVATDSPLLKDVIRQYQYEVKE